MTKAQLKLKYILKDMDDNLVEAILFFISGMKAQKEIEQEEEKRIDDEVKELVDKIKENNTNVNLLELANQIDEDAKWLLVQLAKTEDGDMSFQNEYQELIENKTLEEIFTLFSLLTNNLTLTVNELLSFLLKISQLMNTKH